MNEGDFLSQEVKKDSTQTNEKPPEAKERFSFSLPNRTTDTAADRKEMAEKIQAWRENQG